MVIFKIATNGDSITIALKHKNGKMEFYTKEVQVFLTFKKNE